MGDLRGWSSAVMGFWAKLTSLRALCPDEGWIGPFSSNPFSKSFQKLFIAVLDHGYAIWNPDLHNYTLNVKENNQRGL